MIISRHKGKPSKLYSVVMRGALGTWSTEMLIRDEVMKMAKSGDKHAQDNICIDFRNKSDFPHRVEFRDLDFYLITDKSIQIPKSGFFRR